VLIALTEASFRYPGRRAPVLEQVTLEVRRGDRWVVLGENGAGKSTFLELLRQSAPRGVRVVPVPQDPDLALSATTVGAELRIGPREAGKRRPEAEEVARETARKFGLARLWDRAPQGLSRGERLRVAVAAAVAARPDVLLLDEPTAGQDPARVAHLLAEIASVPGMAVVVCTHDPDCAAALGAQRWRVAGGRVVGEAV
jgi:cobalt/nickel transport system ATP-binding protein